MVSVNNSTSSQALPVVAHRPMSQAFCDTFEGIAKSKIIRTIAVSAGAILLGGLLITNPGGWIASALVVASLAAIYLRANKQKISFECVTLGRLVLPKSIVGNKFDKIEIPNSGNKFYLGSLPNELDLKKMKGLVSSGKLAVLSINEDWELTPRFASHPVSEERWAQLGVPHHWIDALDHKPLDLAVMEKAADWIHEQIAAGKDVYVHCRAGVGRSATAIAAYFIKYTSMSIEDVCVHIKAARVDSTIWDKVGALRKFDQHLIGRPKRSERIDALADALDLVEVTGRNPEIKKLTPQIRKESKQHVNDSHIQRGQKPIYSWI